MASSINETDLPSPEMTRAAIKAMKPSLSDQELDREVVKTMLLMQRLNQAANGQDLGTYAEKLSREILPAHRMAALNATVKEARQRTFAIADGYGWDPAALNDPTTRDEIDAKTKEALVSSIRNNQCHVCHISAATQTLSKCARCRVVLYCSKACQARDWPKHKLTCKKQ